MAGRISSLLDPARITLAVQATERIAALHEIALLFAGHPALTNFDGFCGDLLARDRLDTTNLGNGIAVPHARTEHVDHIVLAVGRSALGIPFEGGETVRLMFMLGTPNSSPGDYLQVLGALCKILKAPANRAALISVPTPADFIAAIVAAERKLGL
jgi:mannitol/fructose-specific phosphotransferase system IIA component (Ntr-type)